jgi:hypothetical protein
MVMEYPGVLEYSGTPVHRMYTRYRSWSAVAILVPEHNPKDDG